MKTPLMALSAALLLTVCSCQKDDPEDELPGVTQDGKHTFGCLVGGQVFIPKPAQATSITRREPLEAYTYRTDLLVSARGNGGVDFALRNAFRPGTYSLGVTRSGSYGRYAYGSEAYYTDEANTGTVTLTRIDTVAKVASGTFQFTALNYQTNQTVTITAGRFDVRLK